MRFVRKVETTLYYFTYTKAEREALVRIGFLPPENLIPEEIVPPCEYHCTAGDLDTLREAYGELIDFSELDAARSPVHIVYQGRALCGLQGVPGEWPDGQRWVRLGEVGANCPGCLATSAQVQR